MKIISDFVDYYDHFQESYTSLEPSIIYMRKTHNLDPMVSLKVQEELDIKPQSLRCFSDKNINPTWMITPFIIGASGRINRGVKIRVQDEIDHSYTLTGALYIPKKMGITISQEIQTALESHFENPIFDDLNIFKLADAPALVIVPDCFGFTEVLANPCLKDYGYPKACMSGEIYKRIKAFINNHLVPCDDSKPYTQFKRTAPKILGLASSGWALNDGLPKGY